MRDVPLCRVPGCNTPAAPASGVDWPICSRHLARKEEVDRRWGHKPTSRRFVPTAAELASLLNDGGRRT